MPFGQEAPHQHHPMSNVLFRPDPPPAKARIKRLGAERVEPQDRHGSGQRESLNPARQNSRVAASTERRLDENPGKPGGEVGPRVKVLAHQAGCSNANGLVAVEQDEGLSSGPAGGARSNAVISSAV